jgi:Zn-dependent protease with chaperone function
MAHEIGHISKRHLASRMAKGKMSASLISMASRLPWHRFSGADPDDGLPRGRSERRPALQQRG